MSDQLACNLVSSMN